MKRLTDEMVIARTKISDLNSVRKLNCWGSEICDVSLLRRMGKVEILSFSVNKINSLADFQYCTHLVELYMRQNNIPNLNEICYLKKLMHLKHLWLAENPCANVDNYRLTVIRTLPQLERLDNIPITPEEVQDAARRGTVLTHPDSDEPDPDVGYYSRASINRSALHSPEAEDSVQEVYEPSEDYYEESKGSSHYPEPSGNEEYTRRPDEIRRNSTYSPELESNHRDINGTYVAENDRNGRHHEPTNSEKEWSGGALTASTGAITGAVAFKEPKLHASASVQSLKEYSSIQRNDIEHDIPRLRDSKTERCERASCVLNHNQSSHRRPVTRNSNILSAVLCLIKELDYESLAVVEVAVKCHMDELV